MKRVELELEHLYKDKFIGRHHFTKGKKLTIIGSSPSADIRLMGEDVSSVHAYLEFDNDTWRIIDAGSKQGTWINKEPITSTELTKDVTATIGGHELRLKTRTLDFELFGPSDVSGESTTGNTLYHQVIVRRFGHVVRTVLLGASEKYTFTSMAKDEVLPPPEKSEFKETVFGDFTVQQRLVRSGVAHFEPQTTKGKIFRKEVRAALLGVLVLFFLTTLLIVTLPQNPEEQIEPPKMEQNRFTKMIVDANTLKKKREEARERQKRFIAKAGGGSPNQEKEKPLTTPIQSKGGTPKVVGKLKMEGLTALLGKISKRATNNGVKIVSNGRSADEAGLGRATSLSVGSLQGVATTAGNGGTTFKVGGVGTLGKGGGSSVKGTGGLALGGAGSAEVGVVDDETEIEGGLDKDVIARVINSHLGEIRYCYERQLSAEPDIYGKVVVKFTINAGGAVATQRVGLSSLRSAMVEGCILRRVAGWKFPLPKGGTEVLVTYPFLFKSTN